MYSVATPVVSPVGMNGTVTFPMYHAQYHNLYPLHLVYLSGSENQRIGVRDAHVVYNTYIHMWRRG